MSIQPAAPTPTSYGEIVALDLTTGAETVLTDHGSSDVTLFVREERTFTISDGTEVQAWLVRDPERQGPLPMLLDVHGGPHNAWNAPGRRPGPRGRRGTVPARDCRPRHP